MYEGESENNKDYFLKKIPYKRIKSRHKFRSATSLVLYSQILYSGIASFAPTTALSAGRLKGQ